VHAETEGRPAIAGPSRRPAQQSQRGAESAAGHARGGEPKLDPSGIDPTSFIRVIIISLSVSYSLSSDMRLHHSLKSPLCSCVAITLPAAFINADHRL